MRLPSGENIGKLSCVVEGDLRGFVAVDVRHEDVEREGAGDVVELNRQSHRQGGNTGPIGATVFVI